MLAAENIQEAGVRSQELGVSESSFDDFVANPQSLTPDSHKSYVFDINGVKYAEYVRRQLEAGLRDQGELPPNVTLGVIAHYVDMKGTGQIWLNEDGLPSHQVIHMEFPPERGALHWTESNITTSFSNWNTPAIHHQLFWAIPRLVDDPSLLTRDPLSLFPTFGHLLPNRPSSENIQNFGFLLGISLVLAALAIMAITHRKSPRFYGAVSLAIMAMMLVTPLMQSNHVQAFSERQQTRLAEQQHQQEVQQKTEDMRATISGRNFDPSKNPLESGSKKYEVRSRVTDSTVSSYSLLPTPYSLLPQLQTTCVLTTGGDCDNDGLDDDIELYELGTDPEDVDTDSDGISDLAEVEGFMQGGERWHLDPVNPDSNGDGTLDGVACPELQDVITDTIGTPSGSQCLNSDSDSTPDVFDYDDDADGVPDTVDSSPLDVAGPFNHTSNQLEFNLTLNQNGTPIFVDFEVRPTDANHLYYTKNVLDWPDTDSEGQWTKVLSTTFADLDDYDSGDGDIMLNPLLEFLITYDSGNPTAGLPFTSTITHTTPSAISDYSDISWLDTDELQRWGVSINEGPTSDTLLLWAPLNVLNDNVGDAPVTWNARMPYRPQTEQATLGHDQQVRVVWMVEGIKDTCNVPSGEDYDTYCADTANWSSGVQIMQTYYDDFTLTGLTVREDHGGKINIIAEPATVGNDYYDDYLWHLADSLQDTFVRGEQNPDTGQRFSVDDISSAAATWGVSGLNYTSRTLSDQGDLAEVSATDNLNILNNVHSGAATGDTATLLYAGEEEARTALLSDDATQISGNSVTVDLTQVDKATTAILRFSPFEFKGAGVWEDIDLSGYQEALKTSLGDSVNVLTDAQLDSLVAANGETISDYDLARDGAVSLAQGYYLALYIGLNGVVELNDTAANSDPFAHADLTLSGSNEVVTNIVAHMLEEMQDFYAARSVVTALVAAGETTAAAANALSATFAESQAAMLDALGEASRGDISSALSMALAELGNYYKTSDVDTSKFTDYASISEQFYISTVSELNTAGAGWATLYVNAKYIWGLSSIVWGMKVLAGTAGTVAKTANIVV